MYCIQLIQDGIESNLLYNPENIINGIIRAGVKADALFASWKRVPVSRPREFPTKVIDSIVTTIHNNKCFTEKEKLLSSGVITVHPVYCTRRKEDPNCRRSHLHDYFPNKVGQRKVFFGGSLLVVDISLNRD